MPFSDHAPRLNFLKSSASALSTLSPSTAAYLMTTHHGILLDEYKPLNIRQHEASCGACGSIRRPECTKTIQVNRKKKKTTATNVGDGALIYKCLRCRRRAIKPIRKETVRSTVSSKVTASSPSTSVSTTPTSTAEADVNAGKADNANSKKRAKTRKQGGLQALMASKKQNSSGGSLDLFDFLS
ncbi:hypothetical protein FE257_011719 [Aspergillus nanangensis]|uniref:Uncharacterized protein n=1 Tax=Aspergillus nanangensis TaxID=2582783 RepID=A0AAD4CV46_ASPNN|nr:hypothetical protein FE257_011719 [Aspergillus nanangensis]